MSYPTITTTRGLVFAVLGVDASQAAAERFDSASAPEQAIAVINECIDLSVPMFVAQVLSGNLQEQEWATFRPHAVESVRCPVWS